MAIVINGSGTVTGLSVGGLPDGTVDAGTLASNAVTEAKIASNAVVTAKLNDDAVTNAKIANDAITEHELAGSAVVTAAINDDAVTGAKVAAGGIIQVVQGSVTSSTTINGGNTYTTVGLSANITPLASSSKILIHIQGGGHRIDAHDMAWKGNVFRGSTDLASTLYSKECLSNHYVYGGTNASAYDYEFPESIQFLDEPSTTSQITYTYKAKASNTLKWNVASAPTTITLMEIAG